MATASRTSSGVKSRMGYANQVSRSASASATGKRKGRLGEVALTKNSLATWTDQPQLSVKRICCARWRLSADAGSSSIVYKKTFESTKRSAVIELLARELGRHAESLHSPKEFAHAIAGRRQF